MPSSTVNTAEMKPVLSIMRSRSTKKGKYALFSFKSKNKLKGKNSLYLNSIAKSQMNIKKKKNKLTIKESPEIKKEALMVNFKVNILPKVKKRFRLKTFSNLDCVNEDKALGNVDN